MRSAATAPARAIAIAADACEQSGQGGLGWLRGLRGRGDGEYWH